MKAIKFTKSAVLSFMFLFYGFLNSSNAQWVQVSNGMGNNAFVSSLAANVNTIFAGTNASPNIHVYKSTNNGTTWTETSLNGLLEVTSLAANGNNIFAGTYHINYYHPRPFVFLSTDNGTTWTQTSLNNQDIHSLAVNGNNVFAGTSGSVYKSTDNGTNWTQTSLIGYITSLAANGNNIFAGATSPYGQWSGSVNLSTDNGTTWGVRLELYYKSFFSLAVNGNNVFAGTSGVGVYKSTDNGTTWTHTSLNNQYVRSLAVKGNNVFAGTDSNGVYVSTNNGTNWMPWNEGLGNTTVNALCISNDYIFAGTGNSVYRRTLELTGIQPISGQLPAHFELSQNYPNPFNPSTKIKFQMPNEVFVKLIVFDVLGREVAILVNEQLKPGTYEVDWNASNFSSGVYFYQLTVSSEQLTEMYRDTKRMILIK